MKRHSALERHVEPVLMAWKKVDAALQAVLTAAGRRVVAGASPES